MAVRYYLKKTIIIIINIVVNLNIPEATSIKVTKLDSAKNNNNNNNNKNNNNNSNNNNNNYNNNNINKNSENNKK